jgi:superfamily I DNA and/or RNA helicase
MIIPFVKSCYLDWHYRSRDEALINFSNHHVYQERLVTFPGPGLRDQPEALRAQDIENFRLKIVERDGRTF